MDEQRTIRPRRSKQPQPLKVQLLMASRAARERAEMLPSGTERQFLLRLARETKQIAELESRFSSPGLHSSGSVHVSSSLYALFDQNVQRKSRLSSTSVPPR
jgi:hypothetical protein